MKYAIGVSLITKIYCELEGKIPIIPKGIPQNKNKKNITLFTAKNIKEFSASKIQNTAPGIFVDINS